MRTIIFSAHFSPFPLSAPYAPLCRGAAALLVSGVRRHMLEVYSAHSATLHSQHPRNSGQQAVHYFPTSLEDQLHRSFGACFPHLHFSMPSIMASRLPLLILTLICRVASVNFTNPTTFVGSYLPLPGGFPGVSRFDHLRGQETDREPSGSSGVHAQQCQQPVWNRARSGLVRRPSPRTNKLLGSSEDSSWTSRRNSATDTEQQFNFRSSDLGLRITRSCSVQSVC